MNKQDKQAKQNSTRRRGEWGEAAGDKRDQVYDDRKSLNFGQ